MLFMIEMDEGQEPYLIHEKWFKRYVCGSCM